MIIKLTVGELSELLTYQDGPFGENGFRQLMAGFCAKVNEETGELDIDRDGMDSIAKYRDRKKKRILDRVFKRAISDAMGRFIG